MHLIEICRKALWTCGVFVTTTLCGIAPVQASVTINFSAVLVEGTCDLSLDKTMVNIGSFPLTALTPSALFGVQSFRLSVDSCSGVSGGLTPIVTIRGEGINPSGRWMFRNATSSASNLGVMLFRTDTPPAFSDSEIVNGGELELTSLDTSSLPYSIPFYAGMACSADCGSATAGTLEASVAFEFSYR